MKRAEKLIQQLAIRMAEIDGDCSRSMYVGGGPDDGSDRSPTGDDYNLLWDAIIDECRAVCPGLLTKHMNKHLKPEFRN